MSDLPLCISCSPYPNLLPTPFPFTGFRSASWLGFPSPIRLLSFKHYTTPSPQQTSHTPNSVSASCTTRINRVGTGCCQEDDKMEFCDPVTHCRPDNEVVTWKNVPSEEAALDSTMVQAFGKYERTMNIRTMELAGC